MGKRSCAATGLPAARHRCTRSTSACMTCSHRDARHHRRRQAHHRRVPVLLGRRRADLRGAPLQPEDVPPAPARRQRRVDLVARRAARAPAVPTAPAAPPSPRANACGSPKGEKTPRRSSGRCRATRSAATAGSGEVAPEYAAQLVGATRIVIVRDNDAVGLRARQGVRLRAPAPPGSPTCAPSRHPPRSGTRPKHSAPAAPSSSSSREWRTCRRA